MAEVKYGLTSNLDTYNPVKAVFHEKISWVNDIKNSKSIKEALKYTFYGPEKMVELRELNKKK